MPSASSATHTGVPTRGTSRPHLNGHLYREFLSYYRSQWHLFAIDSVAALVMTAVDLAFPIILRQLAGGLFTEGPVAILASLGTICVGLV